MILNPSVHQVPVIDRLPVGRVEWALTPTRLYGIDRAGQVYSFAVVEPSTPREAAWLRFARSVVRHAA